MKIFISTFILLLNSIKCIQDGYTCNINNESLKIDCKSGQL